MTLATISPPRMRCIGGISCPSSNRLEDIGICCVDVVVGWHEGPEFGLSNSARPGQYLYLAEAVKKKKERIPPQLSMMR